MALLICRSRVILIDMKRFKKMAFLGVVALCAFTPVSAQELRQDARPIEELLSELADPNNEDWKKLEKQVQDAWSKSGSRTVDHLLKRGRDAMDAEDYAAALEHFTAVTDHAPDFAEGWNGRATVFFFMDQYGLSIEDIERVLALNPQHYSALTGLGIMLERMGDEASALDAFREAQALHPHQELVNEAIERLVKDVKGREI